MTAKNNSQPIVFSFESSVLLNSLCNKLPAVAGKLNTRSFPDGESYIRIETPVKGCHCIILADLSQADAKFLPFVFLAATLRELGASSVGLLAPYLSYMRQDRRFIDGEAVTSRIFAKQISNHVDWLVTVDPHLHRYHSLDEIYSIPNTVVQGAPALAKWLVNQKKVFLVGPDAESEQWVSQIAERSGHPFVIGEKQRFGDTDVVVSLPSLLEFQGYTAIIIDDVISSGQTILKCIEALNEQGICDIKCAAVHGIFANNSDLALIKKGLTELITTNTIAHASNKIDIAGLLLLPVQQHVKISGEDKA